MRIPEDAIISEEKLTRYLLAPRLRDDKSGFLGQAGFSLNKAEELERALRKLASEAESEENGRNEYGRFLRTEGELTGPTGRRIGVVLIWLQWFADGSVHLVTVKPRKER
jgi:hypothetical protein